MLYLTRGGGTFIGGKSGGFGGLLSGGGGAIGLKIGCKGGSNPGACPNNRGSIIRDLLKLLSLDGISYG